MSYTAKLNGVSISTDKIDQKSIDKIKYASEEGRFIAKRSMLKFIYYNTDLSFHDADNATPWNLIQIFKDGDFYWFGIIKNSTIKISHDRTQFTAYDVFKYTKEWYADDLKISNWVGMKVEDFAAKIANAVADGVQTKTGQTISIGTDVASASEYALASKKVKVYDYNGNIYNILVYRISSTYNGFKVYHDTSKRLLFFQQSTQPTAGATNYYFGVINGATAFYLSDSSGDRMNVSTTSVISSEIFVASIDTNTKREICFYYKYMPDPETYAYKTKRMGFDGQYKGGETIEVTNWAYELYYDSSGDLQIRFAGGVPEAYMDFLDAGSREYDYEYIWDNNVLGHDVTGSLDYVYFKGRLLPLQRYPFDYSDSEEEDNYTIFRMLRDLAIFCDAFVALYKDIQVYAEDQCVDLSIAESEMQGNESGVALDFEIDFSSSLHPNWSDYISDLQGYYADRYGDTRIKYEIKLYYSDEILLKNKVNGNRIIELRKENNNFYKIKTIGD